MKTSLGMQSQRYGNGTFLCRIYFNTLKPPELSVPAHTLHPVLAKNAGKNVQLQFTSGFENGVACTAHARKDMKAYDHAAPKKSRNSQDMFSQMWLEELVLQTEKSPPERHLLGPADINISRSSRTENRWSMR